LFDAHRVEYLIVGGYALAFHGAPRFTGDLDIFVKPDAANTQRIMTALAAFGFACVGLTQRDFARPDQVIQLGVPLRTNFQTRFDFDRLVDELEIVRLQQRRYSFVNAGGESMSSLPLGGTSKG